MMFLQIESFDEPCPSSICLWIPYRAADSCSMVKTLRGSIEIPYHRTFAGIRRFSVDRRRQGAADACGRASEEFPLRIPHLARAFFHAGNKVLDLGEELTGGQGHLSAQKDS